MFNCDGAVRRCDLNLRAEYPEIETRIYRLNESKYEIYCSNLNKSFIEVSDKFNNEIRFATIPVSLINTIPHKYEYELHQIKDHEISKNFEGMPLREIDIFNILASKFPNIKINKILGNEGDFKIKVYIDKDTLEQEKYNLKEYLDTLKLEIPFEILIDNRSEPVKLFENSVLYIYSPKLTQNSTKAEERDEALWYDNIDNIYNNAFKKKDLYFYDEGLYSCFVDFSSFENINIRNQLFLYDKVFLTLPIEKPISYFFDTHKIHSDEFYDLVKKDRINIVLTQPSQRYDTGFLEHIFSINDSAIISRRAISALMLMDLIEIYNNYFINQLGLIKEIPAIAEIISKMTGIDVKYIYKLLVWPIKAVRQSFNTFNFGSPIKVGNIGINNAVEDYVSSKYNKDLKFEFSISAANLHLSNSLNATYFPYSSSNGFTDLYYIETMRYMLNFFKNSSLDNILNYNDFKINLKDSEQIINPILLFEINDYIPVREFNNICEVFNTSDKSQNLIKYLSNLTDRDRESKIKEYNDTIEKRLSKIISRKQYMDFTYNAALDTAGIWIPFLSTGIKAGEILAGKSNLISEKRMEQVKEKISNVFSGKNVDKRNIDFLTRINMVARLKIKYE
jgi:hypothetical protein